MASDNQMVTTSLQSIGCWLSSQLRTQILHSWIRLVGMILWKNHGTIWLFLEISSINFWWLYGCYMDVNKYIIFWWLYGCFFFIINGKSQKLNEKIHHQRTLRTGKSHQWRFVAGNIILLTGRIFPKNNERVNHILL